MRENASETVQSRPVGTTAVRVQLQESASEALNIGTSLKLCHQTPTAELTTYTSFLEQEMKYGAFIPKFFLSCWDPSFTIDIPVLHLAVKLHP